LTKWWVDEHALLNSVHVYVSLIALRKPSTVVKTFFIVDTRMRQFLPSVRSLPLKSVYTGHVVYRLNKSYSRACRQIYKA